MPTNERPGVYSSIEVTSTLSGSSAGKVVGLAAAAASGIKGECVKISSYGEAVSRFGSDCSITKLIEISFSNGASAVQAVAAEVTATPDIDDYRQAFDALMVKEDVSIMLCDSHDGAVHAAMMSAISGAVESCKYRIGIVETGGTVTEVSSCAAALNCERMVMAYPAESGTNATPGAVAAAVAGAVAAAAREGGSFGNVPAESVCYMSLAPVGVARCYNPLEFSGGADEEADNDLRARILASYASLPNGSNSAYYKQAALDTDGVAAAAVMPCERGLGTVDIIISSANGLPSQTLIDTLQDKLDEQREICVDIDVLAPAAVTVNISVQVDVADGYNEADILAAVEDAIGELFDGKLLGKNVLLAKLGSVIYSVEGVENYAITLPAEDVTVSATQLPVAGTVTVTGR